MSCFVFVTESPAWHLISCKRQVLRVLLLISSQQLEPVTDCRLPDPHHTHTSGSPPPLLPCLCSAHLPVLYLSLSLMGTNCLVCLQSPVPTFFICFIGLPPFTSSYTSTLPTGSPPVLPSVQQISHGALLMIFTVFRRQRILSSLPFLSFLFAYHGQRMSP